MDQSIDDVKLEAFDDIFRLDGKVAVVTGGSRGLGLNIASGLLQAGCSKVYITSRDAKACESAVAALNKLSTKGEAAEAISVPGDISRVQEIKRVVGEIGTTTSHVDILVANAGTTWAAPLETTEEESFTKVMDLNVKSVFYTIQQLLPLLTKGATPEDPSRIIITASISGLRVGIFGDKATYAYSTSKAAAVHLAKNLAVGLGPRHINTNAIAPGYYPTKLASILKDKEVSDRVKQGSPNGRLGKKEDIAALAVFLSGRGSAHINGTVIASDGGSMLSSPSL